MVQKKRGRPKGSKKQISYLLKKDDSLYLVPDKTVDTFTAEDALRLSLIAIEEQKRQLLDDALTGDKYINSVRVVDGLEVSINKLQEMYPWIKDQIKVYGFDRKTGRA